MSDSESEGFGAAMEVDGGEAPGSDHGTATGADETLGTAGLGSGGGHASRNCGSTAQGSGRDAPYWSTLTQADLLDRSAELTSDAWDFLRCGKALARCIVYWKEVKRATGAAAWAERAPPSDSESSDDGGA